MGKNKTKQKKVSVGRACSGIVTESLLFFFLKSHSRGMDEEDPIGDDGMRRSVSSQEFHLPHEAHCGTWRDDVYYAEYGNDKWNERNVCQGKKKKR